MLWVDVRTIENVYRQLSGSQRALPRLAAGEAHDSQNKFLILGGRGKSKKSYNFIIIYILPVINLKIKDLEITANFGAF